jgi:glycosyltransferase involved in cell wall biosynthesis
MRVALLSRNVRPADAIGQQVLAKVRYFQQLGSEIRLFLSEGEPLLADCRAVPYVMGSAACIWRDGELRSYLHSSDLVIAEFGAAYDLLNLLPALTGRGPRLVVNYRGLTPLEFADTSLHAELEQAQRQRGLLWCADLVIADSQFAARELQQSIGLPLHRVRVMPCWVSADQKQMSGATISTFRDRAGIENSHVLLYVGRLAANKQPDLIIRALPSLRNLPRPVRAVFVGETGDVYQAQRDRCLHLAKEFGVERQVQFTGRVEEATLNQWYAVADVVVLPSLHEGFGMPVLEAMMHGVPVLCSDRAALPETLGHAGLTFAGESSKEFAGQLKRLLSPTAVEAAARKVAFVTHRFGTNFAGGAEASLRRMARTLRDGGWDVEIYTTCNEHDSRWSNSLPAGCREENGLKVHRFPIDPFDQERLGAAYERVRQDSGAVSEALQRQYLENSLGSEALVAALRQCHQEYAAILAGPYLFKLTWQVAKAFADQVLLVPCFHDEPLAYLPELRRAYRNVGGMIFHSPVEARFTAEGLALNHPRHAVLGTLLPSTAFSALSVRGQSKVVPPYLVYCGRYCPEKGLPELLECLEAFHQNKEELKLVCMGQGPLRLPKRPWLVDLGFVSEEVKRETLSGAVALVNLSANESLSIVALEAWALRIPVLGSRRCAVLQDQIERAQGGACIGSKQEFCQLIQTWLQQPELRQKLGSSGLQFVRDQYGDEQIYRKTLESMIESLRRPLQEIAKEQGLKRAKNFGAEPWLRRFSDVMDYVQLMEPVPSKWKISMQALQNRLELSTDDPETSLTLRLKNQGDKVLACAGPARMRLMTQVFCGEKPRGRAQVISLAESLLPGKEELLVTSCSLPMRAGKYVIRLSLFQESRRQGRVIADCNVPLVVRCHSEGLPTASQDTAMPSESFIQAVRQIILTAKKMEQLPETYQDVTEGRFAKWKKWLKGKLLNNFRKAYVDVAFRQQSALNQKLITAISLILDTIKVQSAAKSSAHLMQRLDRLERKLKRERKLRRRLEGELAGRAGEDAYPAKGNST